MDAQRSAEIRAKRDARVARSVATRAANKTRREAEWQEQRQTQPQSSATPQGREDVDRLTRVEEQLAQLTQQMQGTIVQGGSAQGAILEPGETVTISTTVSRTPAQQASGSSTDPLHGLSPREELCKWEPRIHAQEGWPFQQEGAAPERRFSSADTLQGVSPQEELRKWEPRTHEAIRAASSLRTASSLQPTPPETPQRSSRNQLSLPDRSRETPRTTSRSASRDRRLEEDESPIERRRKTQVTTPRAPPQWPNLEASFSRSRSGTQRHAANRVTERLTQEVIRDEPGYTDDSEDIALPPTPRTPRRQRPTQEELPAALQQPEGSEIIYYQQIYDPQVPPQNLANVNALDARRPMDATLDYRSISSRLDTRCAHCRALHWLEERITSSSVSNPAFRCCMDGEVDLLLRDDYPTVLRQLFDSTEMRDGRLRRAPQCAEAIRIIRHLNNSFSFCSLGGDIDMQILQGRGNQGAYTFRLHGALYHQIGSLLPEAGRQPAFAQLYIFDGDEEQLQRRGAAFANISLSILSIIQRELARWHPFVRSLMSAADRIRNTDAVHVHLSLGDDRGQDPNRYNRPTVSEVAALIPTAAADARSRDIILQRRDGRLQRIAEWTKEYLTLRYPFIYPRGEPGWHEGIPLRSQRAVAEAADDERDAEDARPNAGPRRGRGAGGSTRVTQMQWFCFHLQIRTPLAPVLLMTRLLHEWMVDAYAAIERNRLNWFRQNQPQLRLAVYGGLVDALSLNDRVSANDVGLPIMLPATHIGSPRQMRNAYLDAMAIARHYGAPDFFLTVTCNPRWIEVTRELHPGQDPADRPDLLNRVFKMKLTRLMHDLTRNAVLGEVLGYCYTIEFQKRGLPHAHIILILHADDRVNTVADIDAAVRADIPDEEEEPLLRDVVTRFMVHKKCGDVNPRAPCMRNGECRFRFPFEFREETHISDASYPLHRRPQDGRVVQLAGDEHEYTNCDIAPYNPLLSVRYNAHINLQVVSGFQTIKYAFKYVFKGPDRAVAALGQPPGEQQVDEIQQFLDARYVAANEAHWRISSWKTHDRFPPVVALAIHLPEQHSVVLRGNEPVATAVRRGADTRTTLTQFFKINADYRAAVARGDVPLSNPTTLLYQNFPGAYTWTAQKQWRARGNGRFALGRLTYVPPSKGELFCLRVLLASLPGFESFEACRRGPDGVQLPTFQAACIAHGLLLSDSEYVEAMREAATTQMGPQIRELFVTILVECTPADPRALWDQCADAIAEDCAYLLQHRLSVPAPTEQDAIDLALCYIRDILQRHDKDLTDFHLPFPQRDFTAEIQTDGNRLVHAETSYDAAQLEQEVERSVPRMNEDQRRAYDALVDAVQAGDGGIFFVDGPGGTGKTFLQTTTLAYLRAQGKIALATASSGIAATLLPGGTTAHSRFKIPVPVNESSTCSVSKRTHLAQLIQRTELVFWDEAVMAHRHCVEAVDRMFRDVRDDDRPFGGVVFCFCGDFRQTLPIVPRGSPAEIVSACLKRSALWERTQVLQLTINMRLQRPGMLAAERDAVARFANSLLEVGNGTATSADNYVQWATDDIVPGNAAPSLAREIFPNIERRFDAAGLSPTDAELLRGRAILAPTNARVTDLNNLLITTMHGEMRTSTSIDTPDSESCAENFPVENLNAMNDASLPPHRLQLRVGCPVILLRNLDPANGLCNGTRLRVERIHRRILQCSILCGARANELCYLPRIPMQSPDFGDGCKFKRHQWPVKLAFAMTINKAQGQSLSTVGLLLEPEVFGHGQLYVALSRVTSPQGIRIVVPDTERGRAGRIRNVVFADVFDA